MREYRRKEFVADQILIQSFGCLFEDREAGPENAPTILLLHGFPTSSNMFRNLIPRLATSFHVMAPDYPGFGQSSMPSHEDSPTFSRISLMWWNNW